MRYGWHQNCEECLLSCYTTSVFSLWCKKYVFFQDNPEQLQLWILSEKLSLVSTVVAGDNMRRSLGIFLVFLTLLFLVNLYLISTLPGRFILPIPIASCKQNDMLKQCNSLGNQSTLTVNSNNFMVDPVHKVAICRWVVITFILCVPIYISSIYVILMLCNTMINGSLTKLLLPIWATQFFFAPLFFNLNPHK